MTADELRAQHLADTLQLLVEHLTPLKAGLDLEDLAALGVDEAFLLDFIDRYERAPNDADTAEIVLPAGVGGWPADEDTEPIGLRNRSRSKSSVRRR
jgi:hypothetical protein